jgi:ABC-type nitrate/sulfonate/bicarbonate transport system permease component
LISFTGLKTLLLKILIASFVPFLLLLCWHVLFLLRGHESSYAAEPLEVFKYLMNNYSELFSNLRISLQRIASGVIFGSILGIVVGVSIARSRFFTSLLAPTLNVFAAIPIIVLIPFFLMIFGPYEPFRIAIVGAVVFFIIYQAIFNVVIDFPKEYLDYADHRKKSILTIVFSLYLQSAMPALINAIRLSLLFGWLAVAFAEKSAAVWPGGGLGYQIIRAKEQGHEIEMFAAVIVLASCAALIDFSLKKLQIRNSRWMDVKEPDL